MTLFNSTYLWSFIAPIDKILQFISSTNNNNDNNNRLPSKLYGLQILAVQGFRNRSKTFFKKRLMPAFISYVSTHLRGLQLQKFIYEIRTSGHNVRFLRPAPHNKTSVNMHSYYASRCKFVV